MFFDDNNNKLRTYITSTYTSIISYKYVSQYEFLSSYNSTTIGIKHFIRKHFRIGRSFQKQSHIRAKHNESDETHNFHFTDNI